MPVGVPFINIEDIMCLVSIFSSPILSHSLSTQYNAVQIYNALDKLIIPDAVTSLDANSLSVELGSYYADFTGTWKVIVVSGT